MSEKQIKNNNTEPIRGHGLRRALGWLTTRGRAVERVVTSEQVEAALTTLRSSIEPAVADIRAHADPLSLEKSDDQHFVHEREWNPDGGDEYPGHLAVSNVLAPVCRDTGTLDFNTDPESEGTLRGQRVSIMRGGRNL